MLFFSLKPLNWGCCKVKYNLAVLGSGPLGFPVVKIFSLQLSPGLNASWLTFTAPGMWDQEGDSLPFFCVAQFRKSIVSTRGWVGLNRIRIFLGVTISRQNMSTQSSHKMSTQRSQTKLERLNSIPRQKAVVWLCRKPMKTGSIPSPSKWSYQSGCGPCSAK